MKKENKKRLNTDRAPSICFTHFRATDGTNLSKSFSIGSNGALLKMSHAQFSYGVSWRRTLDSLYSLPEFLNSLESTDCIATGDLDIERARIRPQNVTIDEDGTLPIRYRTKEAMHQPSPGLVLFDHDPSPLMPDHIKCKTASQLMRRMVEAVPALKNVHWVGRGSSSQGVFNEKTGESYSNVGRIHVYVASNVADLVVLRDFLEVALWRAGLGYIELARNGRRLRRTIIDLSVLSPERLIFEANPILGAGVKRVAPSWERSDG